MRIDKKQQGEEFGFRIIIGDQHSDFSNFAGPKADYVKKRIEDEKGLTVLTDGDAITMVQVLKKEQNLTMCCLKMRA
jgi:uncharacterized Zn ribbon protein